ncbi:hypothetical protein LEP1GSC052_1268 [Leptospira kmetyi serovar Malaysia str. Bejo-Iso9]|nr:hypothetical protein LEP1GSC052_1268 [Leptospira kmetyi serovar Malaysia str. Bejo-Iso9]
MGDSFLSSEWALCGFLETNSDLISNKLPNLVRLKALERKNSGKQNS